LNTQCSFVDADDELLCSCVSVKIVKMH